MNDPTTPTRAGEAMTVSLVIPSLDEALNLATVIPTIPAGYEVVVVEGSRYRKTQELLARIRPDAVLVEQTRYGKGNALACGFAVATGEVIVTFDADGSAGAEEIGSFVAAIEAGADFARGTRNHAAGGSDDITALRDAGNRGLTVLSNLLFGTRFSDLCYGFNAFRRELLPVIALPPPEAAHGRRQWGDGFEVETIIHSRVVRSGAVIVEVPSHEHKRVHGVSNLNAWRDGKRVLGALLRERFRPAAGATAVRSDVDAAAHRAADGQR